MRFVRQRAQRRRRLREQQTLVSLFFYDIIVFLIPFKSASLSHSGHSRRSRDSLIERDDVVEHDGDGHFSVRHFARFLLSSITF